MSKIRHYPVFPKFEKTAHINAEKYQTLYKQSIDCPDVFWAEQAEKFTTWFEPFQKTNPPKMYDVEWFTGGTLNACFNCVDWHLATRGSQIALIAEGNTPGTSQSLFYQQSHEQIC